MGLGLRNATFALNSELQSGLAWAAQDCTTAMRRLATVRPGRRDPGGRRPRRLSGPTCVKTTITWRCAVRAGFSTALKQG
jgi:hypothetical protein